MFQFHDNIITVNCRFFVCTHTLRIRHWAYRKTAELCQAYPRTVPIQNTAVTQKYEREMSYWREQITASEPQLCSRLCTKPTRTMCLCWRQQISLSDTVPQNNSWTELSCQRLGTHTQHAFRLPCSVPDYLHSLVCYMGVSVLQKKTEHSHSLSHSTVWWSTISGSFAKERNWEVDLALYWRKYIFYLLHAFTRTVIRSHSLTYKGPSEQREASFYSLTLPLIDASISLSLSQSPSFSLPVLAQWRTEAIAYFRTHSFTFVHGCYIYVIVLKGTDDNESVVAAI